LIFAVELAATVVEKASLSLLRDELLRRCLHHCTIIAMAMAFDIRELY